MRGVLSLFALSVIGLIGCIERPRQLMPDVDPLLGGRPLPERQSPAVSRTENDKITRTAAPPPLLSRPVSPAALASTGDGPSAGVKLGTPKAADGPTTSQRPASNDTSAKKLTYEELQARLVARGVNWQSLKSMGDGRWHYLCTVPDPKDPGTQLNFEETASGSGGLAAMEAVLRKIETNLK